MEIYPNFNIEKMNSEDKQLTLDKRYIRMALIWAENSYCKRRKVGALIVKEKMIISDGYNGTPAGFENVAKTKTTVHTHTFYMPKQTQSRKSHDRIIAVMEQPYMSHLHHA